MPPDEQNLTHDEIWDDSALVDSWNDALEEYKKYHSIYLNGGNVEELLQTHETATNAKNSENDVSVGADARDEINTRVKVENQEREQSKDDNGDGNSGTHRAHAPPAKAPMAPAGLLSSVRDEGLKRLLMSWYYAGYYTGYYEGQQERSQQPQSGNAPSE